jgi:hypothetical protein
LNEFVLVVLCAGVEIDDLLLQSFELLIEENNLVGAELTTILDRRHELFKISC